MNKKILVFVLFLLFFLQFAIADSYGHKIDTPSYSISRSKISRVLQEGSLVEDSLEIFNKEDKRINLVFSISSELDDFFSLKNNSVSLEPGELKRIYFLIKGNEICEKEGTLTISGSINTEIPILLNITEESQNALYLVSLASVSKKNYLGRGIKTRMSVDKLDLEGFENVPFSFFLFDVERNQSFFVGDVFLNVSSSMQKLISLELPSGVTEGDYVLKVNSSFEGFSTGDELLVSLSTPFLKRKFLGISYFWFLIAFLFLVALFMLYYLIKKHLDSKKRYRMKLDSKALPKKNKDFFFLGKIAEKRMPLYFDPGRLTTHTIVAGATGGGKSISAQVIVEEALKKGISVVVFDPTAQWSGMLRKCNDKKMLAYYPKFGLKSSDAQAFKGNVRQVKNAREMIDINKHLAPGQIQIFSLNKLDSKDMDIFVSNIIRGIFKSNPKEYPSLKTLLVFDEVHRLLPKFGGSGQGFLQIERACREFRKWGLGVLLVSQVLSDFVGEIKANISTEIQMRTRDEGDLERIKTKYGEEFLQSLVKASVGVGMVVNPKYNHAQPFFVNFRPILHSTRRLPDEELEKYNKYNEIIDDFEYQIEQLEEEKVDVFDLKLELKLIKNKLMTGSFSVVEIYVEGLKPRLEKEFEKLGKKPKKRELKLVDEKEILESIEEAKRQREEVEKKEAEEKKESKGESKDEEEDILKKQVPPLTFDNGVMIGSLKEMLDYLPSMDESIFRTHVNDEKNDISEWIKNNFSSQKDLLVSFSTKEGLIDLLTKFSTKNKKQSDNEEKQQDN